MEMLNANQMTAIFRAELEHELGRAMAELYTADDATVAALDSRLHAEAWQVSNRPGKPSELSGEDEFSLTHAGLDNHDIEWVRMLVDRICHPDAIGHDEIIDRLKSLDYVPSVHAIAIARGQMARARAAARGRASQFLDPAIQSAENPVTAMLETAYDPASATFETPQRSAKPAPAPIVAHAPAVSSIFAARDERHFSEVIDDVLKTMRYEGQWSGDAHQQRRIMQTFCWITGNKRLCDYTHLDVDVFRRGLERLPVTFRFGSPTSGAMSRPFAEVVAEIPKLATGQPRTVKTTNRDLSTMSTVARHLAKTAWRPAIPNTLALDFAAATVKGSRHSEEIDTRPPWTRAHLSLLFASPIYTGGGGRLARLSVVPNPLVFHDAAYFVPLLLYYTHGCREEICGLRADEVIVDHEIPHILIQNNDVRGRDGTLAGEKRIARKRALPIAAELIRLGFCDYVRAIQSEGHVPLFPELYQTDGKRGGAQFYAIAWLPMVDYIGERLPVPVAPNGKAADMHSIRALGSSFYEIDGVNEIMRADVMGHARIGTNAKHYSKRMQTEGLRIVLQERQDFMARYTPVISEDIIRHTTRLLPLDARSRVGSSLKRKARSDRGKLRGPRN